MTNYSRSSVSFFWVVFLINSLGHLSHGELVENDDSREFCYEDDPASTCGPKSKAWPGICQTGSNQSPIDLPYSRRVHQRSNLKQDLYQSRNYFKAESFSLTNNGHTVQASFQDDQTSRRELEGSLLGGRYIFSQVHFHWGGSDDRGSEHTMNGRRYPLEAHLVHYSSEYNNFTDALNSNKYGAIAVMGVMFELAPQDSLALAPIVNALRNVKNAKTKVTGSSLRLSNFLYQSYEKEVDVIQYYGSLTTPTCNEGVWWNVVAFPAPISGYQLDAFRMVLDNDQRPLVNNFRPLQTRGQRNLYAAQTSIQ